MILQIIDVLIGLSVVYLIFSTICSSLFELVEAILKKRGVLLERGIGEIFSRIVTSGGALADRDPKELLAEFYKSPHIYSLFQNAYEAGGRNLPSYIPAERFAGAVMTLAQSGTLKADFEHIRNTILMVSGVDLATIEANAEQRVVAVRTQLIAYFDASMERVSGWYGRHARAWLLGIGLVVAGLFNVDTLQLIRELSQDDALRESIVSQVLNNGGDLDPEKAVPAPSPDAASDSNWSETRSAIDQQLQLVDTLGLPVGWKRDDWQRATESGPNVLFKLLGVMLTALALTFGAPFWFDLLNQLASLRTSLKPGDRNKAGDDDDGKTTAVAAVKVETPKGS